MNVTPFLELNLLIGVLFVNCENRGPSLKLSYTKKVAVNHTSRWQ